MACRCRCRPGGDLTNADVLEIQQSLLSSVVVVSSGWRECRRRERACAAMGCGNCRCRYVRRLLVGAGGGRLEDRRGHGGGCGSDTVRGRAGGGRGLGGTGTREGRGSACGGRERGWLAVRAGTAWREHRAGRPFSECSDTNRCGPAWISTCGTGLRGEAAETLFHHIVDKSGPHCPIVLRSLRCMQRHEQFLTSRTELALGRQCGRSVPRCSLALERRTARLRFPGARNSPMAAPQVAD